MKTVKKDYVQSEKISLDKINMKAFVIKGECRISNKIGKRLNFFTGV